VERLVSLHYTQKNITWGQTSIFATVEKNKQSEGRVTTGTFHGHTFLHFDTDKQGHLQLPGECFRVLHAAFLPCFDLWYTFLMKMLVFPQVLLMGLKTMS